MDMDHITSKAIRRSQQSQNYNPYNAFYKSMTETPKNNYVLHLDQPIFSFLLLPSISPQISLIYVRGDSVLPQFFTTSEFLLIPLVAPSVLEVLENGTSVTESDEADSHSETSGVSRRVVCAE